MGCYDSTGNAVVEARKEVFEELLRLFGCDWEVVSCVRKTARTKFGITGLTPKRKLEKEWKESIQ